jgi:hypothetical protein
MEIDENLERAELDGAEPTQHIKLREKIWKQKQAEIAKAENSGGKTVPTRTTGKLKTVGPQHKKKFAAETAKVAGVTKRAINQELRRAEKLADVIDRLPGTSLNSGVEMDALIKLPKEERAERAGTERPLDCSRLVAIQSRNLWDSPASQRPLLGGAILCSRPGQMRESSAYRPKARERSRF